MQYAITRTLTRTFGLCLRILLGSTLVGASAVASFAQSEGTPDIRVEAREVVVPVFVAVRPFNGEDYEVLGLTTKQFHVFEDGKEQEIVKVTVEQFLAWFVIDNLSPALLHEEISWSPRGIWLGPDIPLSIVHLRYTQQSPLHLYFISYVPPPSPEGSCHQVKVQVDYRPKATAHFRDQYCNIKQSLFDFLSGTKLGVKMERYADSAKDGNIPVSLQVVALFGEAGSSRVQIATSFPWKALKRGWNGHTVRADIGVMGLVYDKRGTLVTRFSDNSLYFRQEWSICGNHCDSELAQKYESIPNGYLTQVPLPAGDYDLKLVVSDDVGFGRVQVPFTVKRYDLSHLEISGIVLCKRFHDVLAEPAQYRRLVSNGVEFVPAGDTVFRKGDRMFGYVEVSEPSAGVTSAPSKVQFQMRIADSKTGELKVDTGLRSAESSVQPGRPFIAVAQEIAFDKLPAGAYRLEVQASDSAGNHTAWRAASFTVE